LTEPPPPHRLRHVRLALWLLVGLAVIGAAALLSLRSSPVDPPGGSTLDPAIGGSFTLVGTDGQPFASSRLAGKPYAIFFGFTHCPDVCPTTLARLAKLRQSMGGNNALNIVFVSIDPERDGPKEMREYSTLFRAPIIALTGSPAQIDQVKKSYGIFAEKAPGPAGHDRHSGYSMNHTSSVLLFDRGGTLAGIISATDSDDAALGKLKAITA